jgi:ketosteroid isomerase-like protein
MRVIGLTVSIVIIMSCNSKEPVIKDLNVLKQEIMNAEHDFDSVANAKSIAEAFYLFADENAVIRRGRDSIISGPDGIRNFYSLPSLQHARVHWAPDYVDVSTDGTMGYSYGKYTWIDADSTGKKDTSRGIFHTVWKRQQDGKWKYVWD